MEGRAHFDFHTRRPSCQGLVSQCQGRSSRKIKEINSAFLTSVDLGTA